MLDPNEIKQLAVRFGIDCLVAGLVGAAVVALGRGNTQALETQLSQSHQRETALETRLTSVETSFQTATATFERELAKTHEAQTTAATHTVTERFDPASGKLVERSRVATTYGRTTSSSTTSKTNSQQTQQAGTTKASQQVLQHHDVDTSTTTVTSKPADVRMGVSLGILATGAGVGPAASYELLSAGALHLDVVGGVVVSATGVSPRLGVGAAAEVTPRLAVTAAILMAPAGDPLGLYHPLFPWVGLSPGVGLAYRF